MAKKIELKERDSEVTLYPVTSVECVLNQDGSNIKDSTESISSELLDHKENKDKKHIPSGGKPKQILSWKSEGEAEWEDAISVFTGMEELLAYGVEWNTSSNDPHITRIGNMSLHKTLPIQSLLKGCVAQGNKIMYWLNDSNWIRRKNPVIIKSTTSTIGSKIRINIQLDDLQSLHTLDNIVVVKRPYGLTNDIVVKSENLKTLLLEMEDPSSSVLTIDLGSLSVGSYTVEVGSRLDGYDGTVKVYCPSFYIKSQEVGNKRRVWISTVKIDNTWTYLPEILVDAYRSTVLHNVPDNFGFLSTLPVNSAISVSNTDTYCRGGFNRESYDKYFTGSNNTTIDIYKSDLGKPITKVSRPDARAYARKAGSELLSYELYKNIFYWLWVIEYANFNSQEDFNSLLTEDGYHLGGMGPGSNNLDSTWWMSYTGQSPIIPCGIGNLLGNGTGQVSVTFGDNLSCIISRWRGFDDPIGDIATNLDGIVVYNSASTTTKPSCYIITDPDKYSDSLSNIDSKADRVITGSLNSGYISSFTFSLYADIIPESTSGDITENMCDYYATENSDEAKTLVMGGYTSGGGKAGLINVSVCYGAPYSFNIVGIRTVSSSIIFPEDE